MNRTLRTIAGRQTTGRWGTAVIQLVLIALWHVCFETLQYRLENIAAPLILRASRFWVEVGVTHGYMTAMPRVVHSPSALEMLFRSAAAVAVYMGIEAIIGWVVFRITIRHSRARWIGIFVACWWRTCIFATFILFPLFFALNLMPGWPGSNYLGILAIGSWVLVFAIGPARLGHNSIVRRARRINSNCPVCRYWLRERATNRCPECGTPLAPHPAGGLMRAPRTP